MERSWRSDQTNSDKYTCFYLQRHKVSNMLNYAERHFLHTRLHKIGTTQNKSSEYVTHFLARERTYHYH